MSARARVSAADVVADVLLEYLEAAVYSTLARRGVYPSKTFDMQLLYGIPVRRTRSPGLAEYVNEFLDALRPLVCTGAAKAVSLVITTEEAAPVPLERHVFSFDLVGEAKAAAAALAEKRARPPPVSDGDKEDLVALERLLAEAVRALDRADASLPALPPECTFHLEVLSSDYGDDRSVYWLTQEVLQDHSPAVFPPLGPVVVPVHYMGAAQKAPLLELRVLAERLNAPQPQSAPYGVAARERSSFGGYSSGVPLGSDPSPPYEDAYMA